MANCKSCNAPIVWAVTRAGKKIPVDPGPNGNGNVEIREEASGIDPTAIVHTKGDGFEGQLQTAHFATCPDAVKHRKARTSAGVKPRAATSAGRMKVRKAALTVTGPDGKEK